MSQTDANGDALKAGEGARAPAAAPYVDKSSERLLVAPNKGWHSRGYLPHFDSPDVIQIVTFRLADSLPRALYMEITSNPDKARRRVLFNQTLDQGRGGCALAEPEAAALVALALGHSDGEQYRLVAWVIMPNHVHVLFEPMPGYRLGFIVGSWKSVTARAINRRTGGSGRVWAPDYYDRYVRNEAHFARACHYIEHNPVTAGLTPHAEAWPYSSAYRK